MILEKYNFLLSVEDLSQIFEVSKKTIYKEIKLNKFGKPIKIGRSLKFSKQSIEEKFFNSKTNAQD